MRADRLVTALLVLQARGRVTATELASELEVSVPTARRDLEALSAAGIPVYPQVGRGGGWQLVGGARTDLSGLTSDEAQALFVLLGPRSADHLQLRSALRKLVQALPSTFREEASAAAGSVVVDPAGWGGLGRAVPERVEELRRAVVRRRRVELHYAGRSGESTRVVEPWGLVAKDEVWYLVAGTDHGRRTFRVDRIRDARIGEDTLERPAELDLGREWEVVVDEVEEQRSMVTATVRVDRRALPMLRRQFGRQLGWPDPTVDPERERARVRAGEGAGGHADDRAREGTRATARDEAGRSAGTPVRENASGSPGASTRSGAPEETGPASVSRVDATVSGLSVDTVARRLASFGGAVEVLAPAAVRARLAEIGAELVAANA